MRFELLQQYLLVGYLLYWLMSWSNEVSDLLGVEEDQFKAVFALLLSIVISSYCLS